MNRPRPRSLSHRYRPVQLPPNRQQALIALVAVALMASALILALVVASPVATAPFRMLVQTEFIGFKAKGDARLSFDVIDWEFRDVRPSNSMNGPPVVMTVAVLVGFAAALSTVGGLLLSAAQIFNRLATRMRRIGGE